MGESKKGFFTSDEKRAAERAYEDELIRRYENNLPLAKSDQREARRLIKARAADAKATGASS